MDIKDRLTSCLFSRLDAEYVRLEDNNGISGFVVSPRFQSMPMLDRQILIDDAIAKAEPALSVAEQHAILMIAALTPAEYQEVGTRIRVQDVRELPEGGVEVVVKGGYSDAKYVRGALANQKGVQTTEPRQVPRAEGTLMSFTAKGSGSNPLGKAQAIQTLQGDQYIAITPGA